MTITPLEKIHNEDWLDTPPQRIFPELQGISKYQERRKSNKAKSPPKKESSQPRISEEEVVNVINKSRKGIEDKDELGRKEKKELRKDNVTTEEVVNINKERRKEQKLLVPYQTYVSPSNLSPSEKLEIAIPKVKELETIFTLTGESMEWEKIEETLKGDKYKVDLFAIGAGEEEYTKGLKKVKSKKLKHMM